ncbi:MAG: HD domain-containing protein, partial [Clostridia bacterium]|nr:HD domain-containing protein [Clostridia bacterium]
HPSDDMSVIERAYDFAKAAHGNQTRMSGEPYFVHPCEVALILADIMMDPATIAAGLLHDTVEDVDGVSVETIEKQFGSEIAMMVDGVTKLNHMDFFNKEQQKTESIRKMLFAMAREIRVVLIKLADRLHNMRTLDTQKSNRRVAIAEETLNIYAPLAHRLGVYGIKSELEDLCLKYIDPLEYLSIKAKCEKNYPQQQALIEEIKTTLKKALEAEGIQGFEISGRIKHIYSIYRKMKAQNKSYEQIMDLVAVRVVVKELSDCYAALGVVHSIWKPMPDRIKDYISTPKYGIYQSLHTTVMSKHSGVFEVQIRTEEMHRNAEYGIAAHWRYKEGKAAQNLETQQLLIEHIKASLNTALTQEGIKEFEISGRIKHTYSIYRKMKAQNKTYEQIMDLVAVRVVVKNLRDCYGALGVVHSLWKPVPDRIKDYIHSPKYGIYQSLHTTVMSKSGSIFEVQIRTEEMHRSAEYGIAAHWRYKEGRAADELDDKLSWLRRIIDWSGEAGDADEFSSFLRTDLFSDDVFVFTPAGDIISLPKGATPIDFAYRIHTAVGNRCVGARVDKKMVPLSTQLESGNVIEIITSSTSKGPSLDWLNIVKTGEAKAKIRSYLKNASKDENLA